MAHLRQQPAPEVLQPDADADRLFMLFLSTPRAARTRLAPLDYVDLQQSSRAFTTAGIGQTITANGRPFTVVGV